MGAGKYVLEGSRPDLTEHSILAASLRAENFHWSYDGQGPSGSQLAVAASCKLARLCPSALSSMLLLISSTDRRTRLCRNRSAAAFCKDRSLMISFQTSKCCCNSLLSCRLRACDARRETHSRPCDSQGCERGRQGMGRIRRRAEGKQGRRRRGKKNRRG
eukprot:748993-Hanusia_phi.AAC.3